MEPFKDSANSNILEALELIMSKMECSDGYNNHKQLWKSGVCDFRLSGAKHIFGAGKFRNFIKLKVP